MPKLQFRLLDFHVSNEEEREESSEEEAEWDPNLEEYIGGKKTKKDNKRFTIEAFGKDAAGKTYSLLIENFEPFFYVKVGDHWRKSHKNRFLVHLLSRKRVYRDS